VPVAAKGSVVPEAIEGLAGVIEIETRTGVTVRVVEPEMFPEVAVIVVIPAATAVAIPCDPAALLIVATELAEELQVTDVVMLPVVLFE